jgi:hypothetical protein
MAVTAAVPRASGPAAGGILDDESFSAPEFEPRVRVR